MLLNRHGTQDQKSRFFFRNLLQLTIAWTPQHVERHTVDHFEATRSQRRNWQDLKVAAIHRELYLSRIVGISQVEMEASILLARDVRRKRDETVRKMKNEKLEIAVQSLHRKAARVWGKTSYPLQVAVKTLIHPLQVSNDDSQRSAKRRNRNSSRPRPISV